MIGGHEWAAAEKRLGEPIVDVGAVGCGIPNRGVGENCHRLARCTNLPASDSAIMASLLRRILVGPLEEPRLKAREISALGDSSSKSLVTRRRTYSEKDTPWSRALRRA